MTDPLSSIRSIVLEQLKPDSGIDEREAYLRIVEVLDGSSQGLDERLGLAGWEAMRSKLRYMVEEYRRTIWALLQASGGTIVVTNDVIQDWRPGATFAQAFDLEAKKITYTAIPPPSSQTEGEGG